MDQDLQRYSFHATWNLEYKLAKPFDILMTKIDQHIEDETHETFREEGLLFKSYLYMSGIGESSNKDRKKALECLNKVIDLLKKWEKSPTKDGFLSVAYALEGWIDMDKTEKRLKDLHQLYFDNRNERRKPFEAAVHFIRSYSLSRLGSNRYIESISEFQQASDKCPDNPEYLFSVALMTRRVYGSDSGTSRSKEMETILHKVLEINKDYMYAKVELADINRNSGNISGAIKLLEEVTSTISVSKPVTPEYVKILGHVMKIYVKINRDDADEKVKNIYAMVISPEFGSSTFIEHQRALLAKKNESPSDYQTFLENALEKDPFNIVVKLELIKKKLYDSKASAERIREAFDKILIEHEKDRLAAVKILTDYGTMLFKRGKDKDAIRRYEIAMDITVKHFQLDFNDKHRMKFIPELSFQIMVSVSNLTTIYKRNNEDTEVIFTMINFHYEIRNLYLARAYCERLLQMKLEDDRKYDVIRILAEIEINLSSDIESLRKVDNQIQNLNRFTKNEADKLTAVKKLQVELSFKKAMLRERNGLLTTDQKANDILGEYFTAAVCGHKGAIMRLFSALEVMDENNPIFYETCAYLEISIDKFCSEDDIIHRRLKDLLEAATSDDFKRLRNQQLEMEKAIVEPTDDLLSKIETVIQTSRNMLNSVMHTLEKRYYKPKTSGEKNSLDFFCVHRNFDKNQTEKKVQAQLKKYKWNDVDDELVTFLVEIQPCTNPKDNNWIMAFMQFNNITKHQREGKEYGTYEVYPEDNSECYTTKEYCSLDLARTVCSNISYIWDNLNGFSVRF